MWLVLNKHLHKSLMLCVVLFHNIGINILLSDNYSGNIVFPAAIRVRIGRHLSYFVENIAPLSAEVLREVVISACSIDTNIYLNLFL